MNRESLIAERIAAHRDTYAPQRIEDAGKRNSRKAHIASAAELDGELKEMISK